MRKHIIWSFDKDDLQNILNESKSYVELFDNLNLKVSKSLIKMLQYRIKVDNLDRSKFLENVPKKRFQEEKNMEDILIVNSTYINSCNLKKKLLKHGLLEYRCSICNNDGTWNDSEITLQLDHINGISNDNRIDNLRLLCPNCHSQTETYAGKKKKNKKETKKLVKCNKCGVDVQNKVFCEKCDEEIKIKRRKVERPSKEILLKLVNDIGFSATGRKYGVSDNSIRKWLK
jgi:5-methylcytosine-specific restriction endonuclease McrA